jgi:hypothetical protein
VVHAVQHQLPAPIHHRRLDHLIIRGAGIGLQDRRQPKLRRRHRRLPNRLIGVHPGKLGLQVLVEQLMTVLTQPDEELDALDALDDLSLQPRRFDRRLPHPWTHHSHHPTTGRDAHSPAGGGNLPDPDTRPAL